MTIKEGIKLLHTRFDNVSIDLSATSYTKRCEFNPQVQIAAWNNTEEPNRRRVGTSIESVVNALLNEPDLEKEIQVIAQEITEQAEQLAKG